MSNEYVNASAQFLKESWYRENAGTPEAQQSKLLDEIFEQIVDYCLNCGIEINESVEIANEIIEEDLVEEFYEEFLTEQLPSIQGMLQNIRTSFTRPQYQGPPAPKSGVTRGSTLERPPFRGTVQGEGKPKSTARPDERSLSSAPRVAPAATTPAAPRVSPSAPRVSPAAPRVAPAAPRTSAATMTRTSTASTRPVAPAAPAKAVEPTAPPVPKTRLGQDPGSSIFSREGGRQEYERRMRQAIRGGTKYEPTASSNQ